MKRIELLNSISGMFEFKSIHDASNNEFVLFKENTIDSVDEGLDKTSFESSQNHKHLIDNMWTAQGKIILNALVQTGHSMELTILAEGVEDDKQIEILQSLNCDVLQGFRFFVPMPASNAMARILDLRQQA